MSKTIEVFTLAELKEHHPEVFEKVHERWKEAVAGWDTPWGSETMQSLKATVNACGGTLHDWSIGPDAPCSASVSVQDTFDEDDEAGESQECQKDADWLFENVLKPLGYKRGRADAVEFPGLCPFTGYCGDDNFLEATWKAMRDGSTLSEALESLAGVAGKMMEDDCEQQRDEESMMANWGDNHYTADGTEV